LAGDTLPLEIPPKESYMYGMTWLKKLNDAHARHRRRHTPAGFGLQLSDSIDFVDAARWDAVAAPRSFFLSSAYLSALEKSRVPNLRQRFALVHRGDRPVAAVAIQILDLHAAHLLPDGAEPGWKGRALRRLSGRVLIAGNLFSCGPHGVAFAQDEESPATWEAVAEALYRVRRAERLTGQTDFIMVKDVPAAPEAPVSALKTFSYRPLETEPNMTLALPAAWKTHGDYLAQLTSKYRKSVESVYRGISDAGCRVEAVPAPAAHADRLHALYRQVWRRAKIRLGELPAAYFPLLSDAAGPDRFRCVAVWRGEMMLGFVTVVRDGDTAVGHYLGMDYEANTTLPLYFRLLHAIIETALEWRCARVSFGRTALEVKAKLGAAPDATHAWLRHRVPFLNVLVRNLMGVVPHDEPPERSPFKSVTPPAKT
jgi:hypothetical protein